ncbi:MAG: response regulator transcription factor [Leptolyngbyaceae cyanobacterium bins.59]|nr:response regulator transcription factor [Leptolyngbyaceae cyanobacterium bins.59]
MALLEPSVLQIEHQIKKILIADDEALIRETVGLSLKEEGYDVALAPDGRSAWEMLYSRDGADRTPSTYDLIILDVMLPNMNGLDLCRLIRQGGDEVPILMLSARGSETDRVVGLEVGADDYLAKPFGMRELIARCRALLRRAYPERPMNPDSVLRFKDITLNAQTCQVSVRGQEIYLSPKEFKLLECLITQPHRVWSREQLVDQIWGVDFMGDSKTVDVHIRWLREKLEMDPGKPEYVQTVRGFGYRLG